MNFNDIMPFIQAGNSTFTLYSTKKDQRYTYKIKAKDDLFFAKVLYGPDNTKDYRYIGLFYRNDVTLRNSAKSACATKDMRFLMLKHFLEILCTEEKLPDTCQFYPSGRCGRCGRTLTTPDSIECGIGPECRRYLCNM